MRRSRFRYLLVICALIWALSPVGGPLEATEFEDLGSLEFPNSGALEAQEPFLRGVLLLHSFEFEDAREAFQEARRIDPSFVLAAWGEAMTHNHPLWREQDREAAREALDRLAPTAAERLTLAPTEREKGYLRAVETLYATEGSKEERDRAYERVMAALAEGWPDDLEARAFWSLSILGTTQGVRDFRVYMRAAAVAEEVFAANPRHPGAVHYLIHSYDDPIHAPLGLRAARVYAQIAPAASHAQHMISHIYVALGRWQESIAANVASYRVSVDRAREKGLGVDARNYHALHWLQYSLLQREQVSRARELLGSMREMAAESRSPRALGYHAAMRAAQAVATGVTDAPIEVEEPPFGAAVLRAFTDGWLAAKAGDVGEVRASEETLLAAIPADASVDGEDPYRDISEEERTQARIMGLQLEGLALRLDGAIPAAVARLREAADLEAALPLEYGPPSVVKPSHELLGEVLLAAGRADEAAAAFALALERAPRRRLSLAGLAEAASASGDDATAGAACADLGSILVDADDGARLPPDCGGPAPEVPSALGLVRRSIGYHDGAGRFLAGGHRLTIHETRPEGPDRDTVVEIDVPAERFVLTRLGEPTVTQTVTGDGCAFRVDGREPTTAEAEEHRLDCDRLRFLRDYYTFLWGLPAKLRDPGTWLGPVEAATFDGRSSWRLRVTWDEAVGTDVWYFYFDPTSATLVGYRFYHDEAKGDGEVIRLSGEVAADGMRIPKERAWTAHLDDRYLGTDVLIALERLEP